MKQPTTREPSLKTLENWLENGGAKATDGCKVYEIDGVCKHGCPSWLVALGMV